MIMTAALLQKLLAAFVVLTSLYLTFIFVIHYDLTRKLSRSLFHLLPGIIFFGFGIAMSILFSTPDLIFKRILPIKSGFAKGVLGSTILPYIGASIRTMSIIASLSSWIDKMWFYWLNWRIYYLIRLASVIFITIIPGNVLFKIIFVTNQAALVKATEKLNTIGAWAGSVLGVLLALITILAIPKLFAKQENQT
jgi:hypothetical protein